MNTHANRFALALGAALAALLFAPASRAQCGGIHLPALLPHTTTLPQAKSTLIPNFFPPYGGYDDAGIVGLWHVKFVSEGSEGIPDGTEIDGGYAVWHADGTEIHNTGSHAPATSNFCLGVWKAVGYHTYKLNHFAIAWDGVFTSSAPNGSLVGPARIQELVTLSPGEDKFSGTFTIDQYDESNNVLAHVEGTLSATRIGVDTPESSIF